MKDRSRYIHLSWSTQHFRAILTIGPDTLSGTVVGQTDFDVKLGQRVVSGLESSMRSFHQTLNTVYR